MLDALLSSSQVEELSDLEDAAASPAPGEGSSSFSGDSTDYSSSALTSDTVSGGDAGAGPYISGTMAEPYDYSEYLETLVTNSDTLVAQNERLQAQNEACISLLLIIVIVGMLNYVYKFFKMFF